MNGKNDTQQRLMTHKYYTMPVMLFCYCSEYLTVDSFLLWAAILYDLTVNTKDWIFRREMSKSYFYCLSISNPSLCVF